MFGFFQPTCPCDPAAKGWIERRLHWLWDEFPDNVFNGRKMVLPLRHFFPEPYDASDRCTRRLLDRVCDYMEVPAERVDLKFSDDGKRRVGLVNRQGEHVPEAAAGTFRIDGKMFVVTIDRTEQRGEVANLIGTMAHELAHARLLGERRCRASEFDHELLTDLTVIFLGLGVFLANSPRNWLSQDTLWPGTQLRKPEYLSPPMFGWALAHIAWHRGERRPAWGAHLGLGPRANMKQGVKYLWATGDSCFKP
jgi:hypothetical protein